MVLKLKMFLVLMLVFSVLMKDVPCGGAEQLRDNKEPLSVAADNVDPNILPIHRDPEENMNIIELIQYNGYPAEAHDVTTEDGYIITIHRIPYGKAGPGDKPRQPVIVQHGILLSSIIWVFNFPSNSLGYLLADAGYDVWLTNVRGNEYGQKNLYMNKTEKEFWEFSFHEHGLFDMPAMIDYVLNETRFEKLNYIGYSMGTTMAFIMLSEKPEYQAKINSAMMLAPVTVTQHVTTTLLAFKPFAYDFQALANLAGSYSIGDITPFNKYLASFGDIFCKSPIKGLCNWIPVIISGYDPEQFNGTRFPVYQAHLPSSISIQCLLHYVQLIDDNDFQAYDYGRSKNMQKYGQHFPPSYHISNIKVPIALFWGQGDAFADPVDVANLAPQVSNLVLKYRVPWDRFSHDDFAWAKDAKTLLYDKVLETMKKLLPLD